MSLGVNAFMAYYISSLFLQVVTFGNDSVSHRYTYIDEALVHLNETGYVPSFYLSKDLSGVNYDAKTKRYIEIKSTLLEVKSLTNYTSKVSTPNEVGLGPGPCQSIKKCK